MEFVSGKTGNNLVRIEKGPSLMLLLIMFQEDFFHQNPSSLSYALVKHNAIGPKERCRAIKLHIKMFSVYAFAWK